MKGALLASMKREAFDVKIVCRCYGKNVFKGTDEDDSEGIVSSFCTLEDAILILPMACYYKRLKSVVMLQNLEMKQSSPGGGCFTLHQENKNYTLITSDFAP